MNILTKEAFDAAVVEWAKQEFFKEIKSDFERARKFDSLRSKLQLSVIRRQSPERLRLLSQLLPSQVYWQSPDADRRREKLSGEQRSLIHDVMEDYNKVHRERNDELLQDLYRADEAEIKEQFMIANQAGKAIVTSIALNHKYRAARAGSGEWGLIAERAWGRITVSLNLERTMHLTYRVHIRNSQGDEVRSLDNYLYVLGFGVGGWKVDSADSISDKLMKAWDFASWHVGEYEAIIARLLQSSPA